MAMARGHYHRAGSPISIPCGPIGISTRRNLNLSVHQGDILQGQFVPEVCSVHF
jgi:hypothetical protein